MTVQCAILRVTYLWGQFLQVEGHCGDTMLLAGSVAMLCIGANEMSNIRGRRLSLDSSAYVWMRLHGVIITAV